MTFSLLPGNWVIPTCMGMTQTVTMRRFIIGARNLLAEYGIWIIAWCFFALTCGGFIKGALGVGTPLLTVPMMAQVLPLQMAIAIMAIPVVVANIWQFAQAERSTEVVKQFRTLCLGSFQS